MMVRTPVPFMMLPMMMAPMHPLMTTVVSVVVQTLLLKMDTGSGMHTLRLGASLRDRATLPSPLRGLGPSGGYPSRLRSLRSLRAPLARRFAALTAVAGPTRWALRSTDSSGQPSGPPRLARPGRIRRLRASPRLVAAALRASPVPASPFTGSRTTPCSRVRTSADTAAAGSAVVLRTTPCSTRCTPAAQAPRRLRRAAVAGADFPNVDAARLGRPDRRGGLGFHTRRIGDALPVGARHHVNWRKLT